MVVSRVPLLPLSVVGLSVGRTACIGSAPWRAARFPVPRSPTTLFLYPWVTIVFFLLDMSFTLAPALGTGTFPVYHLIRRLLVSPLIFSANYIPRSAFHFILGTFRLSVPQWMILLLNTSAPLPGIFFDSLYMIINFRQFGDFWFTANAKQKLLNACFRTFSSFFLFS